VDEQMQGSQPQTTPGAVTWFKVYCAILILLYLGMSCLGPLMMVGIEQEEPDLGPEFAMVFGGIIVVMCLALAAVFASPFFLPRKPWVWIFDLILIGLGLSSCCFWPICIPLIIYWVRPDTQRYFGRET
jgi:hypothetical protein